MKATYENVKDQNDIWTQFFDPKKYSFVNFKQDKSYEITLKPDLIKNAHIYHIVEFKKGNEVITT